MYPFALNAPTLEQQFLLQTINQTTNSTSCAKLFTEFSWNFYMCYFNSSYVSRMMGSTLIPTISLLFITIELPLLLMLMIRTRKFPLVVHDFFALYTSLLVGLLFNALQIVTRILTSIPHGVAFIMSNSLIPLYFFLFNAYAMPLIIKLNRIGFTFIVHKLKVATDRQSLHFASAQKKGQTTNTVATEIDEQGEKKRKQRNARKISFLKLWMLRVVPTIVLVASCILTILLATPLIILFAVFQYTVFFNIIGTVTNVILIVEGVLIVVAVLVSTIFVCAVRAKEPFGIMGLTIFSLVFKAMAGLLFIGASVFDLVGIGYGSVVCLFFTDIVFNLDIIISVAVPILQTFVWNKNRTLKNDDETNIESVQFLLQDKEGYSIFYTFAAHEWASENLSFWTAYGKYVTIKDDIKRIERAKELYKLYIDTSGPFAVNIDSFTLKEAKEACLQDSPSLLKIDQILVKVMKEVNSVMQDTFTRFKNTTQYADWKISKKVEEETKTILNWEQTEKLPSSKSIPKTKSIHQKSPKFSQDGTIVKQSSTESSMTAVTPCDSGNQLKQTESETTLKSREGSQFGILVDSTPTTPRLNGNNSLLSPSLLVQNNTVHSPSSPSTESHELIPLDGSLILDDEHTATSLSENHL